jgi:hypothetical protein
VTFAEESASAFAKRILFVVFIAIIALLVFAMCLARATTFFRCRALSVVVAIAVAATAFGIVISLFLATVVFGADDAQFARALRLVIGRRAVVAHFVGVFACLLGAHTFAATRAIVAIATLETVALTTATTRLFVAAQFVFDALAWHGLCDTLIIDTQTKIGRAHV